MLLRPTIWRQTGMSTTQCTYSMLETVTYYNFNNLMFFVLMLDAGNASDRVNYCNLFNDFIIKA